MKSTTTLLHGPSLEKSAPTSMLVDLFFLRVEEKTLPLHDRCRWSLPTWPLRMCTASSPRPTKNRPLPWSTEEDARGGTLGRLLVVAAKPHSLGRGSGQHRGRRTGTWPWPWGLLLAEPPPRVAGHPVMETRKAKAGEGDRRRKVGRSAY
jgi:hypothetical protein